MMLMMEEQRSQGVHGAFDPSLSKWSLDDQEITPLLGHGRQRSGDSNSIKKGTSSRNHRLQQTTKDAVFPNGKSAHKALRADNPRNRAPDVCPSDSHQELPVYRTIHKIRKDVVQAIGTRSRANCTSLQRRRLTGSHNRRSI